MKLNTARVEETLSQFDAQAIPDNHPLVPQLNDVFGEHTFFINNNGLHVVEPMDPTESPPQAGKVVKLAAWLDDSRSSLAPQEPEATGVVIPFQPGDPEPAA